MPPDSNPGANGGSSSLKAGDELKPIRVVVADEHPVVREGISAIVADHPRIRVVGKFESEVTALACLDSLHPDLMLIDPGCKNSHTLHPVSVIQAKSPSTQVVVFTTAYSEEQIYQALRAGAQGYLLKTAPVEQITACITEVARGKLWIPPIVQEVLARRVRTQELTRREKEVLCGMTTGKSNREIGESLKMSEGTVKVHVSHILMKLGAAGRTEALAIAAGRGLISLGARSIDFNGPARGTHSS